MGWGRRFENGAGEKGFAWSGLTKGSSEPLGVGFMCVGALMALPAHLGSSSSYESGFPTGDHELFTTFSWDDQNVRRVFIRKVTASPNSPRLGSWVGGSS